MDETCDILRSLIVDRKSLDGYNWSYVFVKVKKLESERYFFTSKLSLRTIIKIIRV